MYKLFSVKMRYLTAILLVAGVFVLSCAQQPGGGQTGNPLVSLLPIVLIFVVFYFLLIYPKQREQKKHARMMTGIAKGDEVITSSGVHGRVVGVKENIVVLKIAENCKIEIERNHIATILKR